MKEEKLREKQKNVNTDEQVFKRKKGGGFMDWFKRKIATTDKSDKTARFVFGLFVKGAPLTKFAPTNWLLKKAAKLGDTYNSKGLSIPLRVDMETISVNAPVELQKDLVFPPVELIKEAIRKAEYRVIMNDCICRKMGECKDYPIDLGCMFIGKAASVCVMNNIGQEATVEEALAHVDAAAKAGLAAGAYWVEFEQYAWGFQDKDFPDFLAFCFCCPCCCNSIKFENLAAGELKHITNQSIGWHCEVIPDKCIGCGDCVDACPRHFISIKNGRVEIDDFCAGCGHCLKACEYKALHVVKFAETKKDIAEYFEKLNAKW